MFGRKKNKAAGEQQLIGRFLNEAEPPRTFVAEVKPSDGEEQLFELSTAEGTEQPIIRSKATGRFWTIDWQTLLAIALRDGITMD